MAATLVLVLQTSARLLRLLTLLQVRRDWSGAELAERLEVDVRTVRRDVDKLRSLGYPVLATSGTAGGYQLGAGAELPPLLLDDDEAVAVAVGLRTATGGGVAGIEEASLRALTKLEQVLPERLRHRVTGLRAVTHTLPSGGPTVDHDVLAGLATACRRHEVLRFDHERRDGETQRRTVEPHSLVNAGRRWYLLGWDVQRADWRTFRVDRITSRAVPGERCPPREPPGGDARAYVWRSISSDVYRHKATIRVHGAPEAIAEHVGALTGVVEPQDDGTTLLHTGAESLEALAFLVAMLGVEATVVEPPELKAFLQELGERTLRAAGRPGPDRRTSNGVT